MQNHEAVGVIHSGTLNVIRCSCSKTFTHFDPLRSIEDFVKHLLHQVGQYDQTIYDRFIEGDVHPRDWGSTPPARAAIKWKLP